MSTLTRAVRPKQSLAARQAVFCACILPAVERHARFAFRHLGRWHDREDAIQEAIALTWKWFLRLAERGKDVTQFPTALASFACRHVKAGRSVCGQEDSKDVLSPIASRRRGFSVERLPDAGGLAPAPWEEALVDNTRTPVPDQASFRLDFPAWLKTLSKRDRRVAQHLMAGEHTLGVAHQFGISPARVSQLRRELYGSWLLYHQEAGDQIGFPGHSGRARPIR
jgi:hypothetical protein